jgi:hypothetical protein
MSTAQPLAVQLIDAVAPLAVSVLAAVFSYIAALIAKKIKSETVREVATRISELTQSVVLSVQQTYVDNLRSAAQDGVISSAEATEAKERALDALRSHLGPKGKAEALKAFGFANEEQLDAYLSTQIEAAVAKAKATIGTKLSSVIGEVGTVEKVEVKQ